MKIRKGLFQLEQIIKISLFCLLFLSNLLPRSSYADDNRMNNRFGLYLSVLGDPLPSLGGLNVAYNATDYLRLTGGAGYTGNSYYSITSTALGVKAILPRADFSPVVGLNISYLFWGNGQHVLVLPNGILSNTLWLLYTNLGFDYQARDGFDIGAGVNILLTGSPDWFPNLNIGKFF